MKSFTILFFLITTNLFAQDKLNELDVNAFESKPINLKEISTLIGYPSEAKEKDISGIVVVRILVDNFGNYVKHIVIKSPDLILTEAVTTHISKLKFSPSSVKVWVNIPFDFIKL